VRKLHIKISAFTAHFPLKKVQGSFKVLSSACSVLWEYCFFANNFCKHRQLHAKMLISICPTIFFQTTQHQWTNTLKEQCPHLNFAQILACTNLSKTGAHFQIGTSRYKFFAHFTLKVCSTAKSTQALDENRPLSKHAASWTQYFERTLHFQRQMFI